MRLELKGAYSILLDLIYIRDGKLPDDPHFICGHLGCSVRKWNVLRGELIDAGKIVASGGFITNKRADQLVMATRGSGDYPEIISGKSGDNNEIKSTTYNENSDLQAPLSHSHSQKQNISTVVDNLSVVGCADWPDLKVRGWMNDLAAEIGSGFLDPSKDAGLIQTQGVFLQWQRLGLSWHGDVIPIIAGSMAKQRGPVRSWKYFDAAMRERAEEIKNPKPVGGMNGKRNYTTASERREAYYAEIFGTDLAGTDNGTVIDG